MTDAISQPTRRARREQHSSDFQTQNPADIVQDPNADFEREPDIVVEADRDALNKEYLKALEFAEEPVTIVISPSSDKDAPIWQECWVNGKGAEIFANGKWMPNWPGTAPGYLPVGVELTTKRKYVEVMLRKRVDRVQTQHESPEQGVDPVNRITRQIVPQAMLSVVHDGNPKGSEWMRRIMYT